MIAQLLRDFESDTRNLADVVAIQKCCDVAWSAISSYEWRHYGRLALGFMPRVFARKLEPVSSVSVAQVDKSISEPKFLCLSGCEWLYSQSSHELGQQFIGRYAYCTGIALRVLEAVPDAVDEKLVPFHRVVDVQGLAD